MKQEVSIGVIVQCILILVLVLLVACTPNGPASTHTNSSGFSTINQRAAFLEKYVTFRRTYESLDFDVAYYENSGGMVPGPSEWDIRLVATVPASELESWIPQGAQPSTKAHEWLRSVPTTLELTGIDEWYGDKGRSVGIDRDRRIVAYRNWAE
jgi:hypothetical protein